jgi:Xaa-Pro aminopeptidase
MTQYSKHHPAPNARLIVASSYQDANLFWATRMFVPDPFIYIRKGRRSWAVMSDIEIDRARIQARVDDVLPASTFVRRLQSRGIAFPSEGDVVGEVLRELGISGVRVPESFPIALADRLRKDGFHLHVQPDPFWPGREIKTAEEVRLISQSLRTAEEGMGAGIEALKRTTVGRDRTLRLDGSVLTSERLKAIINSRIMERGAVPSHTIVASGEQAVDPHNEGSGPIRADTSIIMDIFPRSQASGYFGDMTRTVVRGRASDRLKAAYRAVQEAQRIGFGRIRPRASAYDIHQAILRHFTTLGFQTGIENGRMQGFFHGTGHGLGLDIHELPTFGLRRKNRFREHQVVTVEPGLYYAGMGGVRLEDVVVVTASGCRNLVRFPKFLEI